MPTERAILAGLDLKRAPARQSAPEEADYSAEESLEELGVLAATAGATVVQSMLQLRDSRDSATVVGSGKVEELAAAVRAEAADVVIFDTDLTPTQQRNLEKALETKVLDRTQLILDIFAHRARTREGQLQVELAQLNYLMPRLSGQGIALSRLGGGIGTRGPGETKLESDRRRIGDRIAKIKRDIETVRKGRTIQRRQRQGVPLATVSLVGYTNAGKSTLFNRLTQADVTADARMFATLDPTVRHVVLPSRRKILFSDTVGFIRKLPTTLVEAFRATLEEVMEAKLLLHVVDASSPHTPVLMAHVRRVLHEIEAGDKPQLLVLNKADLLTGAPPAFDVPSVMVSARTGEGLSELLRTIDGMLPLDPVAKATYRVPAADGATMHLLHERARVLAQRLEDDWYILETESPESVRKALASFAIS
ncbi:MAG: GTPase HflX [Bryobacteraceae bacterium]|nr:GTPase HflX [Bryobacteraceae bacterium]